jgi:dipeptidase D
VSDPEELQAAVKDYDAILKTEYHSKDKDVFCRMSVKEEGSFPAVTAEDTAKCGKLIYLLPGGVQAMSGDMEGLVETSLNMGILRLEEKELKLGFSVRSSLDSGKRMLEEKLYTLTSVLGGSCTSAGDYPGWVYRTDSPLRDKMVEVYQEMFGEKPRVEAIHAGLECGFFLQKKPGLDCVSLGPEMKNIHTTEETMSIASVARGYDYLIRVLEEI